LLLMTALIGCKHTMEVRLPPPDARMCQPSAHRIGVAAIEVAEPIEQEDGGDCLTTRKYAKPGYSAQIRSILIADLEATGCFGSVVDLEAAPGTPVDFSMEGKVTAFNGCTKNPEGESTGDSALGSTAAIIGFGLMGGVAYGAVDAETRRAAGWADVTLEQIRLQSVSENRMIWDKGLARGSSRKSGKHVEVYVENLGDEALGSLSMDIGRKLSRVIDGKSPYGMISMAASEPDEKPAVAVITGSANSESEALATVSADVASDLRPGYPFSWPAERFVQRKDPLEGSVAVVGLFVTTEDAVDWVRTRGKQAKGLKLLQVARQP
jgi:hypothetical protein